MLIAAVPLSVRASALRSLGAAALLTAAPVVFAALRGDTDLRRPLLATTIIGAAAIAYAVEDDAAITLACSPSSLLRRRGLRVLISVAIVLLGWAPAAALAASGATLSARQLAPVAGATAGLALALACGVDRRGGSQAAFAGAMGALTLEALSTAGSLRVTWLPALDDPGAAGRWLAVAAAAWAVALWQSRDPAARSVDLRRCSRGALRAPGRRDL